MRAEDLKKVRVVGHVPKEVERFIRRMIVETWERERIRISRGDVITALAAKHDAELQEVFPLFRQILK